jgi:ParB family chromosome partitioning protein
MGEPTVPKTRNAAPKRRLGRGLGSLLSSTVEVDVSPPADQPPAAKGPQGEFQMLPPEAIRPNPSQPRQEFDEPALAGLAESIRTAGVMQPIVVRPDPGGDGYLLVAGERRWRAASRIALPGIPAVIRDVDDRQAAEWALIENLQREDLNPLERAEAFKRLIDDYQLTHQDIADTVGLDRSSVSNHLRLLELEEPIKAAVGAGHLSLGHAKALLAITNSEQRTTAAARAMRDGWSVRELERRAKGADKRASRPTRELPANLKDLEQRLGEHLGTRVRLQSTGKGRGRVVIEYFDLDQFDGLLQQFGMSYE